MCIFQFRQMNHFLLDRRVKVPHDLQPTSLAGKTSRHSHTSKYVIEHLGTLSRPSLARQHIHPRCLDLICTASNAFPSFLLSFFFFFPFLYIVTKYIFDCISHLIYSFRLQTHCYINLFLHILLLHSLVLKKFLRHFFGIARNMSEYHRQLIPGPSSTSDHEHDHDFRSENGSPPAEEKGSSGTWKKRVSTACLACKKSKRKVSIFNMATPTSSSSYGLF